MNDEKSESRKNKADTEASSIEPVQTIREGAVAASIWLRQSPAGDAYYDFSLSRSWKSMSTEKAGYSKNFFSRNKDQLLCVIEQACTWIEQEEAKLEQDKGAEAHAA